MKRCCFRMARVGRREGLKMMESIKSIELLKGVKGRKIQSITVESSRIDVLVNNAGYAVIGASEDLDMEDKSLSTKLVPIWCYSVTKPMRK